MKSRPIRALGLEPIRQIPIRDVATELGIQLGRRNNLRCPFPGHDDRNPSFSFFPGTNSCRCFGCGRGGSVIDFVAITQGWSIRDAIHWLRRTYFPSNKAPVRKLILLRRNARTDEIPATSDSDLQFLPNPEIYRELLNNHPIQGQAASYLAARGFSHSTIAHFRLGFLPDSQLAASQLCQKFGYDAVYNAGLLNRNVPNAALTLAGPSVLFPFLESDNIVYLQSRLLPGVFGPRWMGPRGIRKPIYNRSALSHASTLYVCEGATDVLAAFEMNLHAIGVTGAATRLPRDVLSAMKGKLVNILPDADGPGRRFGARLSAELRNYGIQSVIKELPMGKDLNEYLLLLRRRR